MKQIFQNLRTGEILQLDSPIPRVQPGQLLIQTRKSLISLGTERMLLEFGKAGWVSKALQHPDRVRQVITKIQTDGLEPTVRSVFNKLEEPLPLGYCNAGMVIGVGDGVQGYQTGDRVISNGPHANVVSVPEHLCAKIPSSVDDTNACFTVLSAVALQGVRLLQPTLGERVAIIGLGLVGLITAQILRAHGCRVIGFDPDADKIKLAAQYGIDARNLSDEVEPVQAALDFSDGAGVDGVIITAATKSNKPIEQAPRMCRKRGRVVLVGAVNLELNRRDFYDREVTLQVSCSYGPGRYEHGYEQEGIDYPIAYVRWTEQRNFTAVLELMEERKLVVDDLISAVIPFNQAIEGYNKHVSNSKSLGLVLDYPNQIDLQQHTVTRRTVPPHLARAKQLGLAIIGAGGFTSKTILPELVQHDVTIVGIASQKGTRASSLVRKFDIEKNTTDYKTLLNDSAVDAVFITTRHDTHASLATEALEAGKHVFLEKPLALSAEELAQVTAAATNHPELLLWVGFNRRFAPHVQKIKQLLHKRTAPLAMSMMVNAGGMKKDHWMQDESIGGGRIIGEGCHFIDLMSFVAGAPVASVYATQLGNSHDSICDDKMSVQLTFADGSIGTLHYLANGSKRFPKERLEVFSEGRVLQLDNFQTLKGYGFSNFRKLRSWKQDKGHHVEIESFVQSLRGNSSLTMQLNELENVTLATFCAMESVQSGSRVDVPSSAQVAHDSSSTAVQSLAS